MLPPSKSDDLSVIIIVIIIIMRPTVLVVRDIILLLSPNNQRAQTKPFRDVGLTSAACCSKRSTPIICTTYGIGIVR